MIRQHHRLSDIPFSENLVFYAPLSEGDLTDHVSGNTFHTVGNATVVFDSNIGMYLFKKSGQAYVICTGLELGLNESSSDFANLNCTLYFKCYFTTANTGTQNASMVSLGDYYLHRFPNVSFSNFTNKRRLSSYNLCVNTYYSIAIVFTNGVCSLYVDSNLTDYPNNGTYSWYDSFDFTKINDSVLINAGNWSGNDGGGYYKDVRVYNRALTAQEVAQL